MLHEEEVGGKSGRPTSIVRPPGRDVGYVIRAAPRLCGGATAG